MTPPKDDFDPTADPADSVDFDDIDLDDLDEDDDEELEGGLTDTCPVCHSVLDEDGECPNPECDNSPYDA